MGIILLAGGTSIPDLLASIFVSKQMKGDMAIVPTIHSVYEKVIRHATISGCEYALIFARLRVKVFGTHDALMLLSTESH